MLTYLYLTAHVLAGDALDRLIRDERGEGVISAAIAVLVMAFLGAAMWIAFNTLFEGAAESIQNSVDQIGS